MIHCVTLAAVQQTQVIRQLSKRSLLLVYSFRSSNQILDPEEYINSSERSLNSKTVESADALGCLFRI